MKNLIFSMLIITLITFIGCKSGDVKNDAGQTEKMMRELNYKVDEATKRFATIEIDLGKRVQDLEQSIQSIKKAIETLSQGEIKITKSGNLTGDELAELMKNYDKLQAEFNSIRDELNKVREQVASTPRVATPDYAGDWRDMADPAKLSAKLDKFTKEYAPKLDATGQRAEFEADMEEYRAEATKEYTREELLSKYKDSLTKQLQEANDERMKEWYNRQIQALEEASGDALDARLENYRRYENMRKLSEIANKYKIPRSEFRNYGMQVYGGTVPQRNSGN